MLPVIAGNLARDHIIEWLGLEGTFEGHLVQPHSNKQGHLQLDQAAQGPVQPHLERFQGGGIYHLSGQPIPVFHHPQCKKFIIASVNLPSFSSKPLPLVLSQQALLKSLSPSFF